MEKASIISKKIVVISGGAGLLGRSFVQCVAKHGGLAVIADKDKESAISLADELAIKYPRLVEPAELDITDKESIEVLINTLKHKYGHIDALVNSAYPRNMHYGRELKDVTYKDFCENVGLHLGGYFLAAQQFGFFFREQGQGNIINLGSIYGTMAPKFDIYSGTCMTMPVEYSAIKSAVVQLTRYFAQYFKRDGIRVNCLSPGGIFDHQPDIFIKKYSEHCCGKGMLEPSDIAGALLFLLSDASLHITGQNFIVDDGFSI